MKKIFPVILSGGSGTRLWPLSRQKTPKQFLCLLDERTLLQKTALRAFDVLKESAGELIIVTHEDMVDETRRELSEIMPDGKYHILAEPEARNTAAAVAYAVQYVSQTFGQDSCMMLLPADHHIGDTKALEDAVQKAAIAADEDYLVTFGITPTRPETGYGYIQKAGNLNGSGAYCVKAFYEKPEAAIALKFLKSGLYLWSSGMHLFKAEIAEKNYKTYAPKTWFWVESALKYAASHTKPAKEFYSLAQKEPFETAVLEKTTDVAVIPCDPQWSDIGSWESLWEVKENKDGFGNACTGQVYCEDTHNSMIVAHDKLVTCVGLDNIIVIETDDSILVAHKNCGSGLKNLVNMLNTQNRQEIVLHTRLSV